MDPDADPGGTKTYGSYGSPTLLFYCQSSVSRNFFDKILTNSPRIFCGYNSTGTVTLEGLSTIFAFSGRLLLLLACRWISSGTVNKKLQIQDTGFLVSKVADSENSDADWNKRNVPLSISRVLPCLR
jgi:hypothetical protein